MYELYLGYLKLNVYDLFFMTLNFLYFYMGIQWRDRHTGCYTAISIY
jgi:hypothetical protein